MLTVVMSPQEQLFIELVNRARADPLAEVRRNAEVLTLNQDVEEGEEISVSPKQPLAPHQALVDAMIVHVDDMLQRDYFAHESPDGGTPSSRARDAGYPTGAGENIAWSGNTARLDQAQEVYDRHTGLFTSVGHRVNMMRDRWREIGPGIRFGVFTQDETRFQSIMAGTLFGDRGGEHFITGVAISDAIAPNQFYEVGEGLGNVLITAINAQTSEVYSVRTGPSGGYSLQVPDGTYSVTATGDRVSRPLRVAGVQVDGENVKVDINTRLMNTRFVEGQFFADSDQDRRRDVAEDLLQDFVAYADLNNNAQRDPGEPHHNSDFAGLFRISDLLPGEYVVRAEVPEGWISTSQEAYLINTSARSAVGADFGMLEQIQVPVAANDHNDGVAGQDIALDVLANDTALVGQLHIDSLRIVQPPQNGQVRVVRGQLVYQSRVDFSGRDSFSYSVADDRGRRSNVASVSVEVRPANTWQNPAEALDVDGDGFVVPRDVLTLVREINANGSRSVRNQVRPNSSPYLDVSGDGFLSPVDVLLVVRFLNRQSAGEPPQPDLNRTRDAVFAMLAGADDDRHNESV